MNWIGIDPSLTSTAMTIMLENGEINYFNFKKNGSKLSKWHKVLSYINYFDFEIEEVDDFAQNEIVKLLFFDSITDCIIAEILALCEPENTVIWTENFSYSSRVGPLIDLVSFSTILKYKLMDNRFSNITVVPPARLKAQTCLLVYGPGEKKQPSKNHQGISGGKFTKPEMLQSLFDSHLESKLKDSLSYHKEELMKKKSLGKPIDDIIDSYWLCILAKNASLNI